MEKDDALTELEIMKEKLDKALYSTQKTIEEKETAHKEYEKMLEKYDRYLDTACCDRDRRVKKYKLLVIPFCVSDHKTKSTDCRTR